MLILPHSYIIMRFSSSGTVRRESLGFLFWRVTYSVGSFGETFALEWLYGDSIYSFYFDEIWGIGVLALVLILVALAFSIFREDIIPAFLLIISGVILLVLRLILLLDRDTFFIDNNYIFDTEQVFYLEIPLGFLIGLISGIIMIRQNSCK